MAALGCTGWSYSAALLPPGCSGWCWGWEEPWDGGVEHRAAGDRGRKKTAFSPAGSKITPFIVSSPSEGGTCTWRQLPASCKGQNTPTAALYTPTTLHKLHPTPFHHHLRRNGAFSAGYRRGQERSSTLCLRRWRSDSLPVFLCPPPPPPLRLSSCVC